MEIQLTAQEKLSAVEFLIGDLERHLDEKQAEIARLAAERNAEMVRIEIFRESGRLEPLPEMQRDLRQLQQRIAWEEEYVREQMAILDLYRRKRSQLQDLPPAILSGAKDLLDTGGGRDPSSLRSSG